MYRRALELIRLNNNQNNTEDTGTRIFNIHRAQTSFKRNREYQKLQSPQREIPASSKRNRKQKQYRSNRKQHNNRIRDELPFTPERIHELNAQLSHFNDSTTNYMEAYDTYLSEWALRNSINNKLTNLIETSQH